MIDLTGLPAILGTMRWLPEEGSSFAGDVDWVFWFIMWLSVFFFVLIVALMVWFALRYRRVNASDPFPENMSSHNTTLELVWSIIPSILILFIFWWGFKAWLDMYTPPHNAEQIGVRAWKWGWEFTYPNGATSTDLYVPFDKPVVLTLRSEDVLHCFYVPAFRTKQDVVPGRYTKLWFKATKFTKDEPFRYYCAEYCGNGHSIMNGVVHVLAPDAYAETLKRLASDVTRILVGGQNGGLDVLEVQAGKTGSGGSGLGTGVHGTAAITAARISDDAQWALTGDGTGTVGLWSLSGLKGLTPNDAAANLGHGDALKVGDAAVTSFAIGADTSYAFVGTKSGNIASLFIGLGNAPTAALINANAGKHADAILGLDIVSKNNTNYLISTGADGAIRVWQIGDLVGAAGAAANSPAKAPALQEVAQATAGTAFTAAATLRGDYVFGATGSSAGLWQIAWPAGAAPMITKSALAFNGHTGAIRSVRVLRTNTGTIYGITGSADQAFRVWQITVDENGAPTGVANTSTSQVGAAIEQLEVTVDGRYIIVALVGSPNMLPFELDLASGATSAFETIIATRNIGVIATGRGKSPIDSGFEIYEAKCATCHSITGAQMACPPFAGGAGGNLWAGKRNVTNKADGSTATITVDEEYIRNAIREPAAQISDGGAGFTWPGVMTNFNELTDRDIDDLIAWFKTGPVEPAAAAAAGSAPAGSGE